MSERQGTSTRREVVVGVDGSEPSKNALRWAARYAKAVGETVHAVIAWETPTMFGLELPAGLDVDFAAEALSVLTKAVETALGPSPEVKIHTSAVQGHPAVVLVREAHGADILALGNRGHSTLTGIMLGSVSLHCVSHAPCPVVVARMPQK
jgi:nucleotide-binding universal stress UspA family protein